MTKEEKNMNYLYIVMAYMLGIITPFAVFIFFDGIAKILGVVLKQVAYYQLFN